MVVEVTGIVRAMCNNVQWCPMCPPNEETGGGGGGGFDNNVSGRHAAVMYLIQFL